MNPAPSPPSGWNSTDYITIGVGPVGGPGTMSLDYLNPTGSSAIVSTAAGAACDTFFTDGTGTITITTLTAKHMTGTFSFTAVPSPGSGVTGSRAAACATFDIAY